MEKEIRAVPMTLEIREANEETEKRTISGYIKYGIESSELQDWRGDSFVEIIEPGAFDESLKTRNVVALWSHDTAQVLGNTRSGTLRIANTENELRFELDIPNTTIGNDAWVLIKRGDVDGVSFGMRVMKEKWTEETRGEKKIYKRSILGAELYEISPVAFPAYPSNEVSIRSLDEYRKKLNQSDIENRKRKLELELDLIGSFFI